MWTCSEYAIALKFFQQLINQFQRHVTSQRLELPAYAAVCVRVRAVWLGTNILCWFVLSVFTARLILQFLQCPDFLLLSSLNEYENGSHTIPPFLVLIKPFFPSKLGSSHVFRIVRHWTAKTKALQRTCRCEPAAEQRSDVKGNRCHIVRTLSWMCICFCDYFKSLSEAVYICLVV